ncbi:precorrin-6y C5,15-methyltransferase (decarboxylating) subunit CbiE [Synechococcus sp. HK01-R]|uniref:precorrin-6y C5,15-methyltransferase (decarboxylating) subunit CbiE n=1 Tax=Synechococcus sp. HK01-R TaxID=2751171 RepID=UPI0016253FCC|nr:precorrin-6y C5,15-methyltransferase (decarboxylating) subunit CbiE [Synechococcus sp. HK01-R]QNG27007.1 precorrin-6y C5,15-methyltransferase (decarboxylating) subunit CbiE [Synechococcus sp. HK01-R]
MIEVIGTDAGAPATLAAPQQQLLREAALIAAPRRLHPALTRWLGSEHNAELIASDAPLSLCDTLQQQSNQVCSVVLASGDPLWFGIGRTLIERLGPTQLRFHPAPSSLQLAFARFGRPWQDAQWLSLHGRDPMALTQRLQQRPKALAVLTDPSRGGVDEVRGVLHSSGLEAAYALWLFEALGHPEERVRQLDPTDLTPSDLHPLHLVVLLAGEAPAPEPEALPLFGLDDGVFLQHDDRPGLMTKREVRIQLLAELELPATGVLWDLGAGTGSVGLEALRLQPGLQLLAIERRGGGAHLIKANAERLGVQAAAVLEADALSIIQSGDGSGADLPESLQRPDRVLVGGGGKDRAALLNAVLQRLNPGGVVVIPLATLEALADLRALLERADLKVRVSQHQAWRGQPLSDGTRLAPMNPVLVLKGSLPGP